MITLNTEQKAIIILRPLTARGNAARLDGVPGWNISDPSIATLEVDPDGMSAVLFAVAIGTTQVSVSADADLGIGIREVVGTLDVTVVEAEAQSIVLEPGTPESI